MRDPFMGREDFEMLLQLFAGRPMPGSLELDDDELHQLCQRSDQLAHGEHKHKCPSCDTVWKHSDRVLGGTRQQFDKAHSCPNCGERQTAKYIHELPETWDAWIS